MYKDIKVEDINIIFKPIIIQYDTSKNKPIEHDFILDELPSY